MKRLLILAVFLLLPAMLAAQSGGGGGNTFTQKRAGAPSGSCAPNYIYINATNGDKYYCPAGTWVLDTSGAISCTSGGSCTLNNLYVKNALCSGSGVATDGTPVLYKFAKLSGVNYVLATTGDSSNAAMSIITDAGTVCTYLAANHAMVAHNGDTITFIADTNGVADNHWVGPSAATAATGADCGAFSGTATCPVVCGYTANGGAVSGGAQGKMVFTGCAVPVEHVISFNLVKSGAVGVFPVVDYNCTIYRVDVTADQSGTFAMDVWRANAAIPAAGGKISGTTWTPLSGAQSSFNTSLSGWTNSGAIAVASGDVFGGTVGTFTTVTNVLVQIRCH